MTEGCALADWQPLGYTTLFYIPTMSFALDPRVVGFTVDVIPYIPGPDSPAAWIAGGNSLGSTVAVKVAPWVKASATARAVTKQCMCCIVSVVWGRAIAKQMRHCAYARQKQLKLGDYPQVWQSLPLDRPVILGIHRHNGKLARCTTI